MQTTAQPAGPMMNALRAVLEPWLGEPKWKRGEGRITLYFRYTAEGALPVPMRLKVETNTREHFAHYGLRKAPFKVASRWFEGACEIQNYELDELLGTKLRALYQRKQARDLFDLEIALARLPVEPQRIVAAFFAAWDPVAAEALISEPAAKPALTLATLAEEQRFFLVTAIAGLVILTIPSPHRRAALKSLTRR